eukprot:SAG25_NODE_1484_length_2931_cov_3.076271_3_plen_158_part_00
MPRYLFFNTVGSWRCQFLLPATHRTALVCRCTRTAHPCEKKDGAAAGKARRLDLEMTVCSPFFVSLTVYMCVLPPRPWLFIPPPCTPYHTHHEASAAEDHWCLPSTSTFRCSVAPLSAPAQQPPGLLIQRCTSVIVKQWHFVSSAIVLLQSFLHPDQ